MGHKPIQKRFCLYCGEEIPRTSYLASTAEWKGRKFCNDTCCFRFHILPFEDVRKSGVTTPEQRKELAKNEV